MILCAYFLENLLAVIRALISRISSAVIAPGRLWHLVALLRVRMPVPDRRKLAVLEGDPGTSSRDYTVRLKMPDGYRLAPHWHPYRENVTVISVTFKVGMGDSFDESKMTAFPAGSFAYLDPDMHHYAMASGEVVVQVHGRCPLQFNYVNS
jgi:hypothetical protein